MGRLAPAPACVMVIFGIRGDLAKRLLAPALYNLCSAGLLADGFKVLGVDHNEGDDVSIRKDLGDFLREQASSKGSEMGKGEVDERCWSWLADRISYHQAEFEDDAAYSALGKKIEAAGTENALFYLATAPRFFSVVAERLCKAGLLKEDDGRFRRMVVEKPFGEDLDSAKELNRRLLACMAETQIYRIDHFLGKETVRNIMVTRFGNGVFEPLWNRMHIDSVQITAAETVGVEERGAFYDKTGALRDMTPNHLLALLAMMAMEPPNSFDPEAVRAEKGRVLEAIRRYSPEEAAERSVRGQYTAGNVQGKAVAAYRDSPNVDPKSDTETFVALELEVDNWRWAGVPFYVRTGKSMSARDTEIAIQFKAAPRTLFQDLPEGASKPNVLVLQIQPDEGLSLCFHAKQPGPDVELREVAMAFRYADVFPSKPATGYETLIYDVLIGDPTLFNRAQDVENGWAVVMPFLEAWKAGGKVEPYAAGEDGPAGAERLLDGGGRAWRPVGK
ncbi:MAG: glucose-6-phosphate dehydrogenase [Caulobacteraceae bacterium]|nr:glucose-6-phosphate dehydrogenase [Caulobacteraceae bacterium]